jgi:hypothetical protein
VSLPSPEFQRKSNRRSNLSAVAANVGFSGEILSVSNVDQCIHFHGLYTAI